MIINEIIPEGALQIVGRRPKIDWYVNIRTPVPRKGRIVASPQLVNKSKE